MLVVLDLDYTLLDTAAFRRALESSLEAHSISPAQFWETFGMIAGLSDATSYSIERHARVLHEQTGVVAAVAEEALQKTFDALPGMLYHDSQAFLDLLRSREITTVLLTFGNTAFQHEKVKRAGIEGYFAHAIYTEEAKESIELGLSEFSGDPVFINDNPNELRALALRYPEARMIRIKRPDGKTFPPEEDVLDVPTFASLEEAQIHLGL